MAAEILFWLALAVAGSLLAYGMIHDEKFGGSRYKERKGKRGW